jgi:hypothetical protein
MVALPLTRAKGEDEKPEGTERVLSEVTTSLASLTEELGKMTVALQEQTRTLQLQAYASRIVRDPRFAQTMEEVGHQLETGEFGDDLISPDDYAKQFLKR